MYFAQTTVLDLVACPTSSHLQFVIDIPIYRIIEKQSCQPPSIALRRIQPKNLIDLYLPDEPIQNSENQLLAAELINGAGRCNVEDAPTVLTERK